MTTRSKAGDNERKFKEIFEKKSGRIPLRGKQCYESADVEISVDQFFEHKGKEFLVEIDSNNVAKLLVGQYVLLNLLRQSTKEAFFLVVHSFKKYDPMRTVKNLQLVNEKLLAGKGIRFGAIHIESLSRWKGGVPGLIKLLDVPNKSLQRTASGGS